jgi:hypothetical protein
MSNFTFLKTEWPDLHDEASKAEAFGGAGRALRHPPAPRLPRGIMRESGRESAHTPGNGLEMESVLWVA